MPASADVDVFDAIASPVRRAVLDRLRDGPLPVGRIAEGFPMSRPAISQHLRVLLDAGLVAEDRVGREHRYRLEAEPLEAVDRWIAGYERFWRERLRGLGDLLAEVDGGETRVR